MERRDRRAATAMILGVVLLLLGVSPLCGQTRRERVCDELQAMHRWVGSGERGRAWRHFLQSRELLAQLDRGEAADPAVVGKIAAIYEGEASGLERTRFATVRTALHAWLEELSAPTAELSEAASEDLEAFTPVIESDVAATRARLDDALAALDDFLAQSGGENQDAWKEYLDWASMQQQLQAATPDWRVLQSVDEKYFRNENGLELPKFVHVREALRDYIDAVYYAARQDLPQLYADQLKQLAGRLKSYPDGWSSDEGFAIGRIVGWLDHAGQARDLVRRVRQRYWRPNLYAMVSSGLVSAGIEQDVDQRQPVEELILGTWIEGDAHMTGRTRVDLTPDDRCAALSIRLVGVAASDNIGYKGSIRIYSKSKTQTDARERVEIDAEGLRSEPAEAVCKGEADIWGAAAPFGLLARIACRMAAAQKSEAQWIADRRAEKRVEGQVEERAAEFLEKASEAFGEKFRNPLLRREAFPRSLRFRTTRSRLYVEAIQANPLQLAAPNEPPELSGDHDLAVRAHQSLVGNFSESVLGGRTLTDADLRDLVEQVLGETPEELQPQPDEEPWSITFSPDRPISTEFGDGRVTLGIRGRRFTRGAMEVNRTIEISAVYQLARTSTGARMTREGDVSVEYPKLTRLSAAQIAMKTFMRKKAEAIFKPEIVTKGFVLPGRWERAGKMQLRQLLSRDGWLVMGWETPDNSNGATQ